MKSPRNVKVPGGYRLHKYSYKAGFLRAINGKEAQPQLRPAGDIRDAYTAGYCRGDALRAKREAKRGVQTETAA